VLRVYACTRFLLVMNIVRLVLIVNAIGWFMSRFGLAGAVLMTLVSTSVVKALAVVKIARVLKVDLLEILPWGRLAAIAIRAVIAAMPAFWVNRALAWPALHTVVTIGTVYVLTYGLTWLISSWWERAGLLQTFPTLPATPPADAAD
jgi:hypothetical protein